MRPANAGEGGWVDVEAGTVDVVVVELEDEVVVAEPDTVEVVVGTVPVVDDGNAVEVEVDVDVELVVLVLDVPGASTKARSAAPCSTPHATTMTRTRVGSRDLSSLRREPAGRVRLRWRRSETARWLRRVLP